jgi:hypothetical protein
MATGDIVWDTRQSKPGKHMGCSMQPYQVVWHDPVAFLPYDEWLSQAPIDVAMSHYVAFPE